MRTFGRGGGGQRPCGLGSPTATYLCVAVELWRPRRQPFLGAGIAGLAPLRQMRAVQALVAQQANVNAADLIAAAQSTLAVNDMAVSKEAKEQAAAAEFQRQYEADLKKNQDYTPADYKNMPVAIPDKK